MGIPRDWIRKALRIHNHSIEIPRDYQVGKEDLKNPMNIQSKSLRVWLMKIKRNPETVGQGKVCGFHENSTEIHWGCFGKDLNMS